MVKNIFFENQWRRYLLVKRISYSYNIFYNVSRYFPFVRSRTFPNFDIGSFRRK